MDTLLPGHILEEEGIITSKTYPSYIALYHSSGKIWEKKFEKPVELVSVNAQLQKVEKKIPDSLLQLSFTLYTPSRLRYISLDNQVYEKYRSLSRLTPKGAVRCPEPHYQILGNEKCKAERRTYALYIYARNEEAKKYLSLKTYTLFDELIDTSGFTTAGYTNMIRMDFSGNGYSKEINFVLTLKDPSGKSYGCDSKYVEFLTPEETAEKDQAVHRLQKEYLDPASPVYKLLLALIYEDRKMYFNSAEVYMDLHKTLSGKDVHFSHHLYNYFLSHYRSYDGK